ncbi:hypothetical protein BDV37DRAFT_248214 [Aspergillus pseudonomiae]|uniref:Uncharacterized protein n=1 Tax=Aspergillus pseudonomiae TaxID=1506151 RepID=A0A5N7DCK4_9EURO|nr:uncharacterized protein BDV37DRAFT_248214 [Aspergillus pseudonomiae]KAE8404121.1 hypothetical protein BDV37DRAFT_248214 [Aspergillus pseudonomiae]
MLSSSRRDSERPKKRRGVCHYSGKLQTVRISCSKVGQVYFRYQPISTTGYSRPRESLSGISYFLIFLSCM